MSGDATVFQFEHAGNVLIVTPHGPFMHFRDSDVRAAYNEAYRLLSLPDSVHLLVDFSRLDYFGSTFVGILIRLGKKVHAGNGRAILCHVSDEMSQMLKTLMLLENPKIDFSWSISPDRAAALAALQSQPATA